MNNAESIERIADITKTTMNEMEHYFASYFRNVPEETVTEDFAYKIEVYASNLQDEIYGLLRAGTSIYVHKQFITKISFGSSFHSLGWCRSYGRGAWCEMRFSRRAFHPGKERDLVETILHECVHSVLDYQELHGPDFQKAVRFLNAALDTHLGTKTYHRVIPMEELEEKRKYYIVCPKCGRVFHRYLVKCKKWTEMRRGRRLYYCLRDMEDLVAMTKEEYEAEWPESKMAACHTKE